MTWTRISDGFNDDPRLLGVTRSARLLHVEALVYCNRHLLDGAFPRGALRRVTDAADPESDAKQLVEAGAWEEVETGWQLDWSHQESGDNVRERQALNADRQKRYRRRKARHNGGDHSDCDSRYCKAVTRNVTALVTPSQPSPARPGGTGAGAGAHGAASLQLRRPAHQRTETPRIVTVGELDPSDLTPWDFIVDSETKGSNHQCIAVSAPNRADLPDRFNADDCDRGIEWFLYEMSSLSSTYREDLNETKTNHGCSDDGMHCRVSFLQDDQPTLEIWVPMGQGGWCEGVLDDLAHRLVRSSTDWETT